MEGRGYAGLEAALEERDRQADARERLAEERDRAADQCDKPADARDAVASVRDTGWTLLWRRPVPETLRPSAEIAWPSSATRRSMEEIEQVDRSSYRRPGLTGQDRDLSAVDRAALIERRTLAARTRAVVRGQPVDSAVDPIDSADDRERSRQTLAAGRSQPEI